MTGRAAGKLHGKIAVVTGAAAGIGRATAELFVREGAAVALIDINADALAEVYDGLIRQGSVVAVACDVAEPGSAAAMAERVQVELGAVDIVYACAGIHRAGTAQDTSLDDWQEVMNVNLRGKWLTVAPFLAHMLDQGNGAVILQTSVGALKGVPNGFAYACAQAGLLGMTRQLAVEYGPRGVRVNAVAAATVDTALVRRAWASGAGLAGSGEGDPADRVAAAYPLRRIGQAVDIARVVAHLASDESDWVTGQIYTIDGGLTAV